MPSVFVSATIPGPIGRVWEVVRDYNGFPSWVPGILASKIEGGKSADTVGCIRDLTISNGSVREELLALSDLDHSYSYNILSAPFEIANFLCTLRLLPITCSDETLVQWSATFDCKPEHEHDLTKAIGVEVFERGLANLKAKFS